jgi:putative ABC transport system substrate-binding protein
VLALLALAGLAAALPAAPGAAQTYAIVRTTEGIPPFEDAIASLKRTAGGDAVEESLEADEGRWPKVREKLSKKSPTIWVPVGPLALKAVAEVDAPVVFVMVATPEQSLPGGSAPNVAGVSLRLAVDVQLKEVTKLLPQAKRLGVLFDPTNPVSVREVEQGRVVASRMGLSLVERTMSEPGRLAASLEQLLAADIDVLWLIADRTVTPPRNQDAFKYIAVTTAKAGVPVVGYADKLTQGGALFSVGPDFSDIGAQAGEMVKRVAAGTPPSDIGIENARKVSLSVNTRVAGALGITLPAEALSRATSTFD